MKIAFFGSPAFALPLLNKLHEEYGVQLVVAQPDKPVGRGLKLTSPPVASAAKELKIPLLQPQRLKGNAELAATLEGIDIAITCAYGKKLPLELLAIPRLGFWNTHTSLLPLLRGAAPIQWALIHGHSVTGTTIMKTDEGMDTGDILLQEELAILPHWDAQDLADHLSEQAATLMLSAIREHAKLQPIPQDHAAATHAPMLSKADGYVRWIDSAQRVVHRYRGVSIWPQTTAFWQDKRLKLTGLSVTKGSGKAGTVLSVDEFIVACGSDAIKIEAIQEATKKPMAASVWARTQGIKVGDQFNVESI